MANRELKFVCSPWSDRSVISGLSARCRADKQHQANQVNSVYFDTLDWAFADEKAASDYLKTKVRVRWYSEVASISAQSETDVAVKASSVFLEVKRKTGSTRDKVRKQLALDTLQFPGSVYSIETAEMIRSELNDVAPELGNVDLFPRILVQYHRRRFVDPLTGSRIAYDSNIRGRAIARAPAKRFGVLLPQSVLEVKGAKQDLPVNLRFLNAMHLKKAAFSKYYECYRELTGYEQ